MDSTSYCLYILQGLSHPKALLLFLPLGGWLSLPVSCMSTSLPVESALCSSPFNAWCLRGPIGPNAHSTTGILSLLVMNPLCSLFWKCALPFLAPLKCPLFVKLFPSFLPFFHPSSPPLPLFLLLPDTSSLFSYPQTATLILSICRVCRKARVLKWDLKAMVLFSCCMPVCTHLLFWMCARSRMPLR